MNPERESASVEPADYAGRPHPSLRRTLKSAIRAAWDSLGFVCVISLTVFIALTAPIYLVWRTGEMTLASGRIAAVSSGAALGIAFICPIYAGACRLAHRILTHDEPSYTDLWSGAARLFLRALVIGFVEVTVTAIVAANAAFYASRGGFGFLLLGAAFLYLLIFWLMNCLYHWPLLIACAEGIIQRDDGGIPRIQAVFRNGFLLAFSAPGFTFALLLIIMALTVLFFLSGVGMALLWAGFTAILTTQATRDQLVRFGVLPPPPDLDEPVTDERWHIT